MTTSRTRAIVSLAATMIVTLAPAACVRASSHPALDRPASVEEHPLSIRFDNYAHEHVHVYLVGERREWLLGRVDPGARSTLRIPAAALAGNPRFVQLAVLTGKRLTLQAARETRATFTVGLPASSILEQRWLFANGHLTPLRLRDPRADVDHR